MKTVAKRVEAYITPEAADYLRAQIADANGNEVCFVGELDRTKRVCAARVIARGHDTAVNALTHLARPGDVVIHNHPDEAELVPSDADLDIAGGLGDAGIASFIVNNAVDDVYVIVEPMPPKRLVPLDAGRIGRLLEPGGAVERQLPGYEHRPQQGEMLARVADAFNSSGIAMVEAGTGTGKTFAYLLPALTWALENKERVVVSTNTINLQEQLVHKDLSVVQRAIGRPVKAVLVKGRANYVCKRKAELQRQQSELFADESQRRELQTLLAWAATSADGSRADLNFTPQADVWEIIQSETDTSWRTRCPHYDTCFYHSARREANTADVLIVNHSLLLADLALRADTGNYTDLGVLPRYDRIILDEAHHLEDIATRHFGARTSGAAFRRVLGRIFRVGRTGRPRGALSFLRTALASGAGMRANVEEILAFVDGEVAPLHQEALDALDPLLDVTSAFLEEQAQGAGRERQWAVPAPDGDEAGLPPEVCAATEKFVRRAALLVARLHKLSQLLGHPDREVADALLPARTELRAQANRLDGHVTTLRSVTAGGEQGDVCWLSLRRGRGAPAVAWEMAPVDVGERLARNLFDRFATVVLSSATLAIGGEFDFLKHRLGLDRLAVPDRLSTLALSSPFAFDEQMCIGLPADLPFPDGREHEAALAKTIGEAVRLTGGRALVLFTSFRALDRAYEACAPALEAEGVRMLRQGDAPRDALLRRFREDETSVLFGVDSFWEGVDVAGAALRNVILCRLPFPVPTDPVFAARAAALEAVGASAFQTYSVPLAVLKVKQGVGRLIRNHHDYGCVVILDSRIVRKPYGRAFLDGLPAGRRLTGTWAQVRQSADRFLRAFEPGA